MYIKVLLFIALACAAFTCITADQCDVDAAGGCVSDMTGCRGISTNKDKVCPCFVSYRTCLVDANCTAGSQPNKLVWDTDYWADFKTACEAQRCSSDICGSASGLMPSLFLAAIIVIGAVFAM